MANNSTSEVSHGQLPKTWSTCLTESVTAVHDFEVANSRLLDGIGVGKHVRSSNFSVGGFEWFMNFFPDGRMADYAGYASVFLDRDIQQNDTHNVRTKFTLNMLEKDSEAQLTKCDEIDHVFSSAKSYWGYFRFVAKAKLKSSSQANNGSLIIRCVLTLIKEPRTKVKRNTVVVPQPNLQDQLCQMWKDGQGADVIFSVGGQLFEAHRCLLAARSLVFKAELFGPMKGKETQCIKIDDIAPEIFEALLHFIYTDSLLVNEHHREGLNGMCESKLSECIDVETVATTLVLAEQHHCKDLKEACVEFMAPRNVLQVVMATHGFKHLVASCPLVMKELLDMVSRGG
ncbi:BTB/POZ and MATH domain-containing protein 2 [Triticum urartu]|uniref:BTB/POZ and MATH domain-containing protein 2 n=2 Tax=Triticum urartu TaxID=4572 RepID=M7ZYL6_TRIUA|nr:BTB/POZ and MATH domain-containing protein 2 [Triticum urartu]